MAGIFTFFTKKYLAGKEANPSRLDFNGLCNGVLAGLVAITAGCDCVEPWAAIIIGLLGSITYSLSVRFANYLKVDDPIEAFQVHGCCGFLGTIVVAFFKKEAGILYGGEGAGELLWVQFYGCLAIIAWAGTMTSLFFFFSNKLGTTRMEPLEEILGGDIHYFGPIQFEGVVENYDHEMPNSPKRDREGSYSPKNSPKRSLEMVDV